MKALKNEILDDQQQLSVETNGDVGTVTRIGNYKNFNTPVKTIIAAGCPNSGWQKVLPVLEEAGLEPASDTFARWHDELLRTVGMSGPLQSDPLWRQGPEIGGIVAETPTAPLLLADSRCLWLLDFWAAKLPQAKFLLFYIHAEAAVAHACTQGIEPQQFLEDWQAANRQLLKFQRCHRRRALLLDAEAAGRQPHGLIETCRHIGLTLHAPSEIPPTDPPAATMERLLADYLVATKPDVQALEAELEATAQPLADDMPAEPLHPVELVSSYLQQQAYKRGLQRSLDETDQKLHIADQAQEQQTAQIRQLTNDLGDQTDLAAACQVQLDQLQLTVQARDAAIASLHEELNNRQDEIGRLQWYLGERDADIVHLNKNLGVRDGELSRMEHELHAQLDEKRKAAADLQTQLERVTQTKDQLVREAAEQQQSLETLLREQDESAQETSELQAQVQQLIQERDAQDKLTDERQATIKQLTKARDEQKKRVADQQAQMEQAQKDHQTLEAAKKESEKENELLLLQLHQVQEELEDYFLRNQNLKQAAQENEKLSQGAERGQGSAPGEGQRDRETMPTGDKT